jgi:hypothetical protein
VCATGRFGAPLGNMREVASLRQEGGGLRVLCVRAVAATQHGPPGGMVRWSMAEGPLAQEAQCVSCTLGKQ